MKKLEKQKMFEKVSVYTSGVVTYDLLETEGYFLSEEELVALLREAHDKGLRIVPFDEYLKSKGITVTR